MNSAGQSSTRSRLEWWLICLFAIVGAICGVAGMHEYALHHHDEASISDAFYHTLQLFLLHTPHLEPPINGWLETGRWFAAAASLLTLLKASASVFYRQWKLLSVPFRRKHVVICGMGRIGQSLARSFLDAGKRVVAVENHPASEAIDWAWWHGIPVLQGNACDRQMLSAARVAHASHVFAVCDDDQTNVAILSIVGELVQSRHGTDAQRTPPAGSPQAHAPNAGPLPTLVGWEFTGNPELRSALKSRNVFPGTGRYYGVNVRGHDLFEVSARRAFEISPLDYAPIAAKSKTRCHLVIIGFGQMGAALALQAARIGHFSNGEKPRVTLLDPGVDAKWQAFDNRYGVFAHICDVRPPPLSLDDPLAAEQLVTCLSGTDDDEVVTIAICQDNADDFNLSLALRLAKLFGDRQIRILVYLTKQCGFPCLFAGRRDSSDYECVKPFGMVEDTCSQATLLNEAVARALHSGYLNSMAEQRAAGKEIPMRPAEKLWEELDEEFKESNRQAADHIPIKARALGYHIGDLKKESNPIRTLNRKQKELLAPMEHSRWCAERWLNGWEYDDTRDDTRRRHPDLRPWEELPDTEQRIDHAQIEQLADALKADGRGFFR